MSEESKKEKVVSGNLTPRQRAEAVSLWRSGTVTLADLSKKFGKRPETFSRMFTKMGIEKGTDVATASAEATTAAVADAMASAVKSQLDETLDRIHKVKERHYSMSQMLAQMAFQDVQRARASGMDVGELRKTMAVYKMAAETLAITRREAYDLLNVPKHEQSEEMDDLPDLTVRELTQNEVDALRDAPQDDDMGTGLPSDLEELEGAL